MCGGESGRNGRKVCFSLGERHSGFEPAKRRIPARAASAFRPVCCRCEWRPQFNRSRSARLHPLWNRLWHHCDDRVWLVVDKNLLAEDAVASGVTFFPNADIDRSYIMVAELVLFFGEKPAHDWPDAQHFEVSARYQTDSHLLGCSFRRAEAYIFAPRIIGNYVLERVIALCEIAYVQW